MPKTGLTDGEWHTRATRFARGESTLRRGEHPRNGKWKKVFDDIKKCPYLHWNNQSTINFSATSTNNNPQCTCGWNHNPPQPPPSQAPAAAAARGYSFTVAGDGRIVLGYYVVPDDGEGGSSTIGDG